MQFNSLEYALLLSTTWLLFLALRGRLRIGLLIVSSLVFYATWNVPLTSLILISAGVDYTVGRSLGRTENPSRRRWLLFASLAVNLSLLGYFKYANFAIESVRAALGLAPGAGALEILLPPGISFYTFQTMSYSIDVYRRQVEPSRSFPEFLLYVSFFPQLIAGPIERAARLLPQIRAAATRRGLEIANLISGGELILWGLFKKMVIADHLGTLVDAIYARPGEVGDWALVAATYAFTLQIYCDFSAYSEIAKGSAKLFGIDLIWNFDQPYLSRSAGEFWRRWHISLSEWFRDYVYVPLGGNRLGASRTLFNLTATMFLSGLWHGAAWNFILWGLYHGVLLLLDNRLEVVRPYRALRTRMGRAWGPVSWLVMLHAVVAGWVLFRVEEIADLPGILAALLRAPFSGSLPGAGEAGVIALFVGFVGATFLDAHFGLLRRIRSNSGASLCFHALIVIACLTLGSTGETSFIYFQF